MSGDRSPGGWGGADALAWLGQRRPSQPVAKVPTAPARAPARAEGAVADAVHVRAAEALRASRTGAGIAAAAAAAGEVADSTWAQQRPTIEARKRPRFACTQGCAWCCYQQVAVQPLEAIAIARHVRATFSPEDQGALKARLAALDDKTRGRGLWGRAQLKTACAFLVDQTCSIYDHRPLRCRGIYSRDSEHCRRVMENPDELFENVKRHGTPGPYPVEASNIMGAALTGLSRGCTAAGLDWTGLELTAALRIALDAPDCAERYLAGEPVFAAAKLPAWDDRPARLAKGRE